MIKMLFNGVDKKVYIFIILLTLFFTILSLYVHMNVKNQITNLHKSNREIIIDEIRTKSSNKLNDIKNLLEQGSEFISENEILENEQNMVKFINMVNNLGGSFDMMQLLTEDEYFYIHGGRHKTTKSMESEAQIIGTIPNRPLLTQREWYLKTKETLKTSVSVLDIHGFFNEQTINICSPIFRNNLFYGALCGIIKSQTMVEKLQQLSLPKNTTFFIVMEDGTCLSIMEDNNIASKIIGQIDKNETDRIQNLNIEKKSISVANLGIFSWKIAVITDNEEYLNNMSELTKNSLLMLAGFIILIIFANIAHESIRFALNKKYNHVKRLTQLWLKDSSRGLVLYDSLKRISFTNQKAKRLLKLIYATHGNMYIDNLLKFTPTKETLHVKDRFYEVVVNPLNDGTLFEGWVLRITDTTKEKELEKQKNEYEQLLAHQGKMVEIGELIGGINHQLKQPITSANLFISNILQEHQNDVLTNESLVDNLVDCQKSLTTMDETIDLYKNYYKTSATSKEFTVKECLKKALKILDEKICRYNIKIKIEGIEDIKINSIESIVQQILLVFLNNAIDSAKESCNKSVILNFLIQDDFIVIKVSDFGKGLCEETSKNLFKRIVDTKKEQGTGLGLYFANKLAKNKINGYIKVSNLQNPTIFELRFRSKDT